MRYLLITTMVLITLMVSSISEAIKVTKIDRYKGIDYKPIEQYSCSIGEKVIRFKTEKEYKTFSFKLLSPKSNSIVKLICPEHIMVRENIVKILRGEEKRISVNITPFEGEIEIEFYDYITKEFVSKLLIVGELSKSNLKQSTTFSKSTQATRINHSIRYGNWGMNISGSQSKSNSKPNLNFSVSKQW